MIYKNVSDQPLVIPNVGEVEPGQTIETDQELNNANLQPQNQITDNRPQPTSLPTNPPAAQVTQPEAIKEDQQTEGPTN